MNKGTIAGSVIRLIFLVSVVVLSFLLIFNPIWESYGSNDCVIYQSEVISVLRSSIETAKKTHKTISRGFDLAQCVDCIWYNKRDGQLMVKYAFKTSLIGHIDTMIVPYNVSSQFVNFGCYCDDCDDCANINENKLYQLMVNETSVVCTNCPDSTVPCGAAIVYSNCTSNDDCYKGYVCQDKETLTDGKCYSMDTIGNWIEFTDGEHWTGKNCTKDYGTVCSSEKECSIYSGNGIEMHLACQENRLSSEKSCCLPLICEEYDGDKNCKNERPSSSVLCNSDEDCNKICGNTACGYVYDSKTDINEYNSCYFLPGESCKYDWQCGSDKKAIKFDPQCDPTLSKDNCESRASCSWCGCERCEESIQGVTHCYCEPSIEKLQCDEFKDTFRLWYRWVGCEAKVSEISKPTKCSSDKCCINSGYSCKVADRDFCDIKYCCSGDIIKDGKCCTPDGTACSQNWQCCSGVCSGGFCIEDTVSPIYSSLTAQYPLDVITRGALINVSVLWSDNGFLKTGIFKHNESGVWDSEEYSFSRNPEYFDASMFIGYVKGTVCWKQEAVDMYGKLNDTMPLQCFSVS